MGTDFFILGFIVLDTLCSSWSTTYHGDRVVSLGGTASTIGLMVSVRALCTTISAPWLGRMSDKIGRRPIALLVAFGTLLTAVLECFASGLMMYGASRFTFGLTRVCITVSNGMICDLISDPKLRAKALGRNFSAVSVGYLLGSALGGAVASPVDGYFMASLVNLILSSISFLLVFLFLKETSKPASDTPENKSADSKHHQSLLSAVKEILSQSDLRMLLLFHLSVLMFHISPQHAYFEYLRTELQLPTSIRGLFLVAVGISMVFAQSSFASIIAKIGTSRFVTLCLICAAITSTLAPMGGPILFGITTILYNICGVVTSASLSTLSNASPPHLSGTVSGIHESLSKLSLMVGGLYVPFATQIHLLAPFLISSVGLILTLLLIRPKLIFEGSTKTKLN